MSDRLDDLLRALPVPGGDCSLDGLESAVWGRIQKHDALARSASTTIRLQLVAAGMALGIGLALGWNNEIQRGQADQEQAALFAGYAAVGPLARLEGPL